MFSCVFRYRSCYIGERKTDDFIRTLRNKRLQCLYSHNVKEFGMALGKLSEIVGTETKSEVNLLEWVKNNLFCNGEIF